MTQSDLSDLALKWIGPFGLPKRFRLISDTSDFFRVDYNDILILNDRPYLVRNNEKEGRFGIDEQPKFWVKRAVDLLEGSLKIIKLVFHERFTARVGPLVFECVRSPQKEARVLNVAAGHSNLMQGFSVRDTAGNLVRVIDFVHGKKIPDFISGIKAGHGEYFRDYFPVILREYIAAVEAIRFIHGNDEIHGDIRRDHLILERETGKFTWIDYDFTYSRHENKFGYDLFGLGNVLVYLTAGMDVTLQQIRREQPDLFPRIAEADRNIIFHNRLVNLKKVFPYIPESLNRVLMHFSAEAEIFYEDTDQFLGDLMEAAGDLTAV